MVPYFASPYSERLALCPPTALLDRTQQSQTAIDLTIIDEHPSVCVQRKTYSNYNDVQSILNSTGKTPPKMTIVTISGRDSISPLCITKEDLTQLISDCRIDEGFDLSVAAFGALPRRSELSYTSFCGNTNASKETSVSYLLRYPEKDRRKLWKIRQLAIYHSFRSLSNTHLVVLLQSQPPAQHALSQTIDRYTEQPGGGQFLSANMGHMHKVIFDLFVPSWRQYLDFLGQQCGALSTSIVNVELKEDRIFDLTLEKLQSCTWMMQELAALPGMLDAVLRIVGELAMISDQFQLETQDFVASSHRTSLRDGKESAETILRQLQGTSDVLGNILSLKNQQDAAHVNEHLLALTIRTTQDSAAIRAITAVTMLFLPATTLATIFGMNFFDFDGGSKRLVTSADLWIYVVALVVLQALGFGLWRLPLSNWFKSKAQRAKSWTGSEKSKSMV